MMELNVLAAGALCVVVGMMSCYPELSIKDQALQEAVEFDASRSQIKAFSKTFARGGIPKDQLIYSKLGKNNLSSFLLTLEITPKIDDYDLTLHRGPSRIKEILGDGESLVQLEHISNVLWPNSDNNIGSFRFKVPNVVSGKCLFRVCYSTAKPRITQMWLAQKGSNKIDSALPIFSIEKGSKERKG